MSCIGDGIVAKIGAEPIEPGKKNVEKREGQRQDHEEHRPADSHREMMLVCPEIAGQPLGDDEPIAQAHAAARAPAKDPFADFTHDQKGFQVDCEVNLR